MKAHLEMPTASERSDVVQVFQISDLPLLEAMSAAALTKIQRPSVRLGPEIAGCNATQIDDTNPVSYQVAGSMRGVWPVGVPEDRAQSKAKHDTRFSNIDAC